jgi:hypothetical protein
MRVHIDDLVAECSHVLPNRWNGFSVPVFTDEQRALVISECERLGWVHVMDDGTPAHLDGWVLLSEGEWVTDGWTWDVMDEICDYCGYLVDPSVTCDCGAVS